MTTKTLAVERNSWRAAMGSAGAVAVRVRLAIVAFLLGMLSLQWIGGSGAVNAGSYDNSLIAVLAKEGLFVHPGSLQWLDEPSAFLDFSTVFFLASRRDEPPDLYTCQVRTAVGSAVVGVHLLSNVTRSSSAAEGRPRRLGPYLAFPVRLGAVYDALVVLDTRGEDPALTAGWPLLSRIQNAITNLQDTGHLKGLGMRRFPFVPSPEDVQIAIEGNKLRLRVDGDQVIFDPSKNVPEVGAYRVQYRPNAKGRPGSITWLVDTVRRLPFVGAERIAWLEHTVFGVTDRLNRAYHGVVPTDVEAEVREAFSAPTVSEERRALLTAEAPEIGFPPPALEPVIQGTVRGEGEWMPVVDDPFTNENPNAPPAFYQTFLRADAEREFARVYIIVWDPRQVDLNVVMGTREPESATGETGDGMIPRDPQTLSSLVAGFNGGFQALHGEFGMMAEGRVYLPPKPYAATVAVFDDGRMGMGSWPGPGKNEWSEAFANRQIPAGMVGMRQNLTSVVEDGKFNPWGRWWWGAAPAFSKEQTYITRSGLCVTQEGAVGYFWGEDMGPEALGQAMVSARCARGMHLDMNSKHTGFEFYRPIPPGASREPLARPLSDAEYDGEIPNGRGYAVRARKALTTMTPLRFPRYVGQDPRDFFYLTLRPILPGPDLEVGQQRIAFRTEGLPHSGFPYPFARAQLAAADGVGTWLVRIDPSRVAFAHAGGDLAAALPSTAQGVHLATLISDQSDEEGELALIYQHQPGGRGFHIGAASDGEVLVRGRRLGDAGGHAALGVDQHGFIVYGEASLEDRRSLARRMARAGVGMAMELAQDTRLAFATSQGLVAVDGYTALSPTSKVVLDVYADTRTRTSVLFPEVEPRPYGYWGKLQDRRVRYFPEGERTFHAPEAELTP